MTKGIAVVSGGLDSTTMIYHMLNEGHELDLVSFNYGQRHQKELRFAAAIARHLSLRHDIVDLTALTQHISNSALTSGFHQPVMHKIDPTNYPHYSKGNVEVPEGHYAEDTMKATVVPNRNMIMLSIAAGIAVNRGVQFVATAVHSGDHFIYPDCRQMFIELCSATVWTANEGFGSFQFRDEAVTAPFLHRSKADIAYRALQLGVPIHMTWSCYKGEEHHCGKCGTCVERLEAIDEALTHLADLPAEQYKAIRAKHATIGGRWDQTIYDDEEFWRQAVREKKEAEAAKK